MECGKLLEGLPFLKMLHGRTWHWKGQNWLSLFHCATVSNFTPIPMKWTHFAWYFCISRVSAEFGTPALVVLTAPIRLDDFQRHSSPFLIMHTKQYVCVGGILWQEQHSYSLKKSHSQANAFILNCAHEAFLAFFQSAIGNLLRNTQKWKLSPRP